MKLAEKFVKEFIRIVDKSKDLEIREPVCWFVDTDIFRLEQEFASERAMFEENLRRLHRFISLEQQIFDAGKKILEEASEAGEASDSEV